MQCRTMSTTSRPSTLSALQVAGRGSREAGERCEVRRLVAPSSWPPALSAPPASTIPSHRHVSWLLVVAMRDCERWSQALGDGGSQGDSRARGKQQASVNLRARRGSRLGTSSKQGGQSLPSNLPGCGPSWPCIA